MLLMQVARAAVCSNADADGFEVVPAKRDDESGSASDTDSEDEFDMLDDQVRQPRGCSC